MQQRGFTLIELIIVIVILGTLAVTVAPKFLDFKGDATTSVVKGMGGAMKSASNIVHAKSLITGNSDSNSATITLKGGAEVDIHYGYALDDWDQAWDEMLVATITSITDKAACASDFCVDESQNIKKDLPTEISKTDGSNKALIIFPSGTSHTDQCYAYYIYDQKSKNEGSTPTIGSNTTGC